MHGIYYIRDIPENNGRFKTSRCDNIISAHQKAKPTYINPIPWQSIVEIESDEVQETTFNDKKRESKSVDEMSAKKK